MKLVENVTGEEVSETYAQSVVVEMLDPVKCQHTAVYYSKSHEALQKILQKLANNSTTGQEAVQVGRVEAGATGRTTAWPPAVAESSEDGWEEYCVINAMGSQQCWTCRRYGHVSLDCTNGKGMGKSKARDKQRQQLRDLQGKWEGEQFELCPVIGYQQGDGKTGGKGLRYGKCYTCGGDHFARGGGQG